MCQACIILHFLFLPFPPRPVRWHRPRLLSSKGLTHLKPLQSPQPFLNQSFNCFQRNPASLSVPILPSSKKEGEGNDDLNIFSPLSAPVICPPKTAIFLPLCSRLKVAHHALNYVFLASVFLRYFYPSKPSISLFVKTSISAEHMMLALWIMSCHVMSHGYT